MKSLIFVVFFLLLNCQANHSRNGLENSSKSSIGQSKEQKTSNNDDSTKSENPVSEKNEETINNVTNQCSDIITTEINGYHEILIKYMNLRSDEKEDSQQDQELQVALDELIVYCKKIIELNKPKISSCKTSNKNISLTNIEKRCEEFEQTSL